MLFSKVNFQNGSCRHCRYRIQMTEHWFQLKQPGTQVPPGRKGLYILYPHFSTPVVEKIKPALYCMTYGPPYFSRMENRYTTLKILFDLAKEEADPTSHFYSFHQVQLQGTHSLETIIEHVDALEKEALVRLRLEDGLNVALTPKGWEMIASLSMMHLL